MQGTGKHGLTVDLVFGHGQFQRDAVTVLVPADDLPAGADEMGFTGFHVAGQIAIVPAAIRIRHQHGHILPDQLIRMVAEYLFHRRVGTGNTAAGVNGDNTLQQVVEQRVQLDLLGLDGTALMLNILELCIQLRIQLLQLLRGLMTLGGVMRGGENQPVGLRQGAPFDPAVAAILAAVTVLEMQRHPAVFQTFKFIQRCLAVIRMDQLDKGLTE